MSEYRVNLDIYNGPLDLLLFLIRRDEVDIHDIPIARITEQYQKYVEMLQEIDPDVAGEFLVMAATLLEIKVRMLLPAPAREEEQEGLALDPRAELVRQLLQYKAFKDAAAGLADAAEERAGRFARRPPVPDGDAAAVEIEDVQVWDLLDAFSKVLESIGHRPTHHEVVYDDTPLSLHQEDVMDRLRREGPLRFTEVFRGRTRSEMVGLFLALLELVRLRQIIATQNSPFTEIHVYANPNPPPITQAEAAPQPPPAEARSPTPSFVPGEAPAFRATDAAATDATASAPQEPPSLAPEEALAAPSELPQEAALPPPAAVPAGQYVAERAQSAHPENENDRPREDPGTGV